MKLTYKGAFKTVAKKHEDVMRAYSQGKSIEEIREMYGYNANHSVVYVLKKYGVYQTREKKKSLKKLDIPKVLALKTAKWSIDEIVKEFCYEYTADEIRKAVKEWRG